MPDCWAVIRGLTNSTRFCNIPAGSLLSVFLLLSVRNHDVLEFGQIPIQHDALLQSWWSELKLFEFQCVC